MKNLYISLVALIIGQIAIGILTVNHNMAHWSYTGNAIYSGLCFIYYNYDEKG